MTTLKIHVFLVQPGKGLEVPPALAGKSLTSAGKLFDLLTDIFHTTPGKRDFEVQFRPTEDGVQQNDCRDLIIGFLVKPTLINARKIAMRLQSITDNRSGMGLLFVMTGQQGTRKRTVISRFPANAAILAEVDESGLGVEFLEQVFIKKLASYKAILLDAADPATEYWKGFATDRQAGGSPENISSYWLDEFLWADFRETPKAGTMRLANALKQAIKSHPLMSVKIEIASAITLAPTALKGKRTSVDGFCDHFGLSEDAKLAITNRLNKPSLSSKVFKFDPAEFKKTVPYRTVEMKSGAILTAPSDKFDKVFKREEIADGQVEYSTRGKVADQRIAGR